MIFAIFFRKRGMKENIEKQFQLSTYQLVRISKRIDNSIVYACVSFLTTLLLLLVHFYQIPYILTGILTYVIQFGFISTPIFILDAVICYLRKETILESYEKAKSDFVDIINREN